MDKGKWWLTSRCNGLPYFQTNPNDTYNMLQQLKPFAWWCWNRSPDDTRWVIISQYFCKMAGSLWNPFGIVSKIGTPHSHGYAIKIHQGWAFAMNINPVGFVWKSCRYNQIQWLIIIFWKKKRPWIMIYTLWWTNIAIENGPVEIVEFPIKKWWIFP